MKATSGPVMLLAMFALVVVTLVGCPPKTEQDMPDAQGPLELGPEDAQQPSVDAGEIQIAIISNTVSPFWTAVAAGMNKAKEELGCKAYLVGCKSGQLAEQRRLMESAEAKQVSGIAVSPLNTEALTPVIDELVDRGVPVLCIDSDCPGSKRYCYIGSNNYEAGALLAEETKKLLPEGAKCTVFVGEAGVENSKARINGFTEGVAEKKIEVLDVMQDHSVSGKARSNVEDTIQKHPDIDALVGIWSYNLPAIASAVKEADKHDQIKVIGFDAEAATIQGLEVGDIDCTVVQNPYQFGYMAVQVLFAVATNDEAKLRELVPEDEIVDTGVEVVNQENFEAFKEKLAKLGITSS